MKKYKVNDFLKDFSLHTEYCILEEGKHKDELAEVAKRHGIKVPARDISIFKGIYAFVDRQNLNGCTLPSAEVEKALDTIGGKAVDFDHYRKRMVGHWLEGHLDGDKIISYGVFNKGNFPEDFETVSELMKKGNLKISMEAWGNRIFNEDGKTYDFTDIEFSGGALLIDTNPAFPGAEVLELAKNMTAPESYIKDEKLEKKVAEYSRMYTFDMDMITRLMYEAKCPSCGSVSTLGINGIDFEGSKVDAKCSECGKACLVHLTPKTEEAREIKEIAAIVDVQKDKSNSPSNGDSKTTEVVKMDELKKLQEEVASLLSKITTLDGEKATLTKSLEEANSKLADAVSKLEKAETEKVEAVKIAKESATKVAERKAELGPEFSKDMSEEEILDDKSFKIKQLEKENASLKAGKVEKKEEKASTEKKEEKKEEVAQVIGTKDKENESFKRAQLVSELAFGKSS